jgi:molybdenum cofactor cytidylyltransferase
MRLTDALRLRPGMRVAFIGAGGKSAALACLAREGAGAWPVVLTTSTRIAREQSGLAANHRIVLERQDLDALRTLMDRKESVLVTGPLTDSDSKWQGLDDPLLEKLAEEVERAGGILAVEADGARGRSLKVPAAHEPCIPGFVDLVVPLVGIDSFGTSISGGWVHRPDDLTHFLGLPPGGRITEGAFVQVLTSPEGALKGVPDHAEVRPILNKVEDPGRLETAENVARRVFGREQLKAPAGSTLPLRPGRIQAVLACHLAGQEPVRAVWGRIAAVVLAAGGSSRLEQPKPLLRFRGRPLVLYSVEAALAAGLYPVTVVVGHASEEVRRALDISPVRVVENHEWTAGQSSSVRLGLEDVEPGIEAVIFFLADMPFVSPATVRRLIERHRTRLSAIVAPASGGRRGNPVLFDRSVFPGLRSLKGDTGGRVLFDRFTVDEIACDELELMDVDTPGDVERLWTME